MTAPSPPKPSRLKVREHRERLRQQGLRRDTFSRKRTKGCATLMFDNRVVLSSEP